MLERLDRLPSARTGSTSRALWAATVALLGAGVVLWAVGLASDSYVPGVVAMWLFAASAALVALVLPLPLALASPLFMGVVGWLVDMLPFVMLIGWTAVVARYVVGLLRERRWPSRGPWVWLPIALVAWTTFGALSVLPGQRKHFVLLFGLQVLSSGAILAAAECFRDLRDRTRLTAGLLAFIVLCSVAVFFQWVGIPVEGLQDEKVSAPVERAYGIDAFVNSTGMIKYERAKEGGAKLLRRRIDEYARENPDLPPFVAFRAPFKAFDTSLVVRFDGSARAYEDDLTRRFDISLVQDNLGLAPGNEIPRMRSFPRNALTYAGLCALLFPFAAYFVWTQQGRRKWLGQAAAAGCLFGAAFSLARGAWVALAVGILYLLVDGALSARRKVALVVLYAVTAVVLTGVFLVKYDADPLNARAGAEGSIGTRRALYEDTFATVTGLHLLFGYGSEQPRDEDGRVPAGLQYVPEAGSHSTYLNYLFRTGIPGALMLISVYVGAGLYGRRGTRSERGDPRTFSTLATAAVVVIAAHGVILSLYVEPVYTLTVSLAIGMAAACGLGGTGPLMPWKRPAAQ